jgi:chromosome segregation ATPase
VGKGGVSKMNEKELSTQTELLKALKELMYSNTGEGFYCPFGKIGSRAIEELQKNLDEKRTEITTLRSENEAYINKINTLEMMKKDLEDELQNRKSRINEILKDLEKTETELVARKNYLLNQRPQLDIQASSLENYIKSKEKLLGSTQVEVGKRIALSFREFARTDESRFGAAYLAEKIANRLTVLYEEIGAQQDKRVKEAREKLDRTRRKVTEGDFRLDSRIPMRFLNLAQNLLTKAEQAYNDEKKDIGYGYRSSVEDLITEVDRIYDDPETERLLQILKSR